MIAFSRMVTSSRLMDASFMKLVIWDSGDVFFVVITATGTDSVCMLQFVYLAKLACIHVGE